MFKSALIQLFDKDLGRVADEISKYPKESDLWITGDRISNSAGNLCLHIVGNLNHFIGATLGNSGYVRDRESEFTQIGIPRVKLLEEIKKTAKVVADSLSNMSEVDFEKEFPLEVMGKNYPTGFFLLHLVGHLNYHLGQINYHRRLLTRG